MVRPPDPTRRAVLMASMLASVAIDARAAPTAGQSDRQEGGKALVAYFSRSGNTQVIAGVISRSLRADLFEIEPAKPYPADYFETVEQARQERDSGYEPVLKARIPGIAAYQTIFLCFPIWGETAPPVIRSFLAAHDLSTKTLVPVITHGGYGLGSSLAVLRSQAPRAQLLDGFTMQGPQERETTTRVTEWLNSGPKAN
jgi:flavodoxin